MNYLAHAWLARHSDDALLGGLLGDFVFGQSALLDWPEPIRAEIVRHRRIDRYTDDHPAVVAARTRFGPLRRYAGIVLDVYFDHCLARDWADYHAEPLPQFTGRVYEVLAAQRELPERLAYIAPHMAAQDWLGSYREFAVLEQVIGGMSRRLSRPQLLAGAMSELERLYQPLSDDFREFYPQLQVFARS